jgi:hypothetical protein
MLVSISCHGSKVALPLSQLTAVEPDESTNEAIGGWHYWVARATVSDLRTAIEGPDRESGRS